MYFLSSYSYFPSLPPPPPPFSRSLIGAPSSGRAVPCVRRIPGRYSQGRAWLNGEGDPLFTRTAWLNGEGDPLFTRTGPG